MGSCIWENTFLKKLTRGPIANCDGKKIFLCFLAVSFVLFFLVELMLSSNFHINLVSSVKHERCAESSNSSCRILGLSVLIYKVFKKAKQRIVFKQPSRGFFIIMRSRDS